MTIGSSITESTTGEDLVRIVTGRHRVDRRGSTGIEDPDAPSSSRRYHAIPLFSPVGCGNVLPLGAVELELSETTHRQDLLSAVAPLSRLLGGVLDMHARVRSTRSAWDEQMNSLSSAHLKQWNNLMEWVTRWSQLPLSDSMPLDSWCEQISSLCRQLVPSVDFVNVFLYFGDDTTVESTDTSASSRSKAVASKLMTKLCGQVADEDVCRELSLHNQCVLGAVAHYPLIGSASQRDEPLGVFVAPKKSELPFTEQEHQLMQLIAQLVSAQASTLRAREDARSQVKALDDARDQRSRETRQLYDAHASVSNRAQQLLLLLEVSRLDHEHQDDSSEHQAASTSGARVVHWYLRSALRQLQSVLDSVGSRESICAVVVDRMDQSKLSCSVIGRRSGSSEHEEPVACVSLDRDGDEAGCWYSTRRWMQHKHPFSSLPPRILSLLGLNVQTREPSKAPDVLTIVPVHLHGDCEHSTDDDSAVFLAIASFSSGGLVESNFIGELTEAVANLLRSRLRVSQLNESANNLSASVATLESQQLELQQDCRLLELTNIVWMEVVGSCSAESTRDTASHVVDASDTKAYPQAEQPIPSCFRRSFHERIVPYLREELRTCAIELVLDLEIPSQAQLSRRNSIACFMDSLDPSRAHALRRSTDSVVLGSETPSSVDSTPRFWLAHRFLRPDSQAPRCFGLFYIEWEFHSPNDNNAAADKARRTLLWLSDWLQTLAQYCCDRCSALDRIYSGEDEVRELVARRQAQADYLEVHEHWKDRWASLLGFVRALQTAVPVMNASTTDGNESAYAWDWGHVFAQLSTLDDTVVWARHVSEGRDVAWTDRRDDTRQHRSWDDVSSWPTNDPDRFQLIVATLPTAETLGVIELINSDGGEACRRFWSNEHAKNYRELLSLIIGSYLTARRMKRITEHERRMIQSAHDELHLEVDQLRQQIAQAWTAYQQFEEWIQQLHSLRDARPAEDDSTVIQALFSRIERRLMRASDSCGDGISRARLLLQIRGGKGIEVATSCDQGCACQSPSSIEAMMKQIARESVNSAGGDGTEPVAVATIPSSDSEQPIFPTCGSDRRMGTEGGDGHYVILQVNGDAREDGGSCMLVLCVQKAESDQNSVMLKMLKVLCLRLVDAIARFRQGSRERKHLSSVEQRLAAVDCELATEQRRSTRIAAAMGMATRWISEALSATGDVGDATITRAIKEVLKCLAGGAVVVRLANESGKCGHPGAVSSSPPTTCHQHSQFAQAGDKTASTGGRRLSSTEVGMDIHVKCRHSAVEGSIDELELEVAGARLVVTSLESHMKADLSLLWQDKSALAIVVKLADALVAIRRAKTESLAHRHEGDRTIAALQTECVALEATCLETKTAFQRSEMQRELLRASVKKALEPIPTHAINFMATLSSESCASRDTVIQALGNALSEIHGVESVAIREPTASRQNANRSMYASPSLLLGGKQPLVESEQIDRIVDRCVDRQEAEVLSLKTGKRDTTSAEVSHATDKRWLIVMPCVVGTSGFAVLLVVASNGQLERSSSRKELYQTRHARLLCRLATWRWEQLATEAALTERVDFLVKGQHELDDAQRATNLQLERGREERHCYQQMVRGVTHDVFQALSWSNKTWQKVFSSTRKLVSVWQHLSDVLQERLATSFASAGNVRVRLYGVLRSKEPVLHLPTAATEFAYSTMMDLAAQSPTRRLWNAVVNPISLDHGPVTEEANGSITFLVPVCSRDDSGCNDLPIAVAAVTIVQPRKSEPPAFGGEYVAAVRDLVSLLAPFIRGISCAVRPNRAAALAKDRNRDHLLGKQRLRSDGAFATDLGRVSGSFEPPYRGHLPVSPTIATSYASSRPGDEFGRGRDLDNQLESVEVLERAGASRRDMRSADETSEGKDEDESASVATSLTSSQGTPKKTRATYERLVPFLLKLQRTSGVKALQRLVADELKGVRSGRSSRSTLNVSFELVDMPNKDSDQIGDGIAIDSVHSALLPEAVLNEVLHRFNSKEPFPSTSSSRLWKFASGCGSKRAPGDKFWVAILTEKAVTSHNSSVAQVVVGLLVIRGSRLQTALSRLDEEVLLPHVLQGLQQQLAQFRRNSELQAQVSDSMRREADHIEQTACLAQMETQHRHLDAFSKLALRLSVAESECELVRVTSQFLRNFLRCRRVDYEPSNRDLVMSTTKAARENQESNGDKSVVIELRQSRCDWEDDGLNNNNGEGSSEQATQLATSSTAVEMQHSVKLRVFSALSDAASSRLLGTFSAHLEPGAAPPMGDVEHQSTLKSVASLVNASFHRLQALGAVRRHGRSGKVVARELQQLRAENAGLLEAREQQQLSIDMLQQQFEDLARVNSSIEAEVAALRSQLQHSEGRRAQSEEDAVLAQQQLVQVAAAADKSQMTRDDAGRLQEAVETYQERVRVLEKRNMRRRLQAQQFADDVGRLKKTEEIDKFRIAELEKQLAVAQQQQQPSRSGERYIGGVGVVGPATRTDAFHTSRRRVSTVERHVDQQQERARRMQKLKQMRLAEELRCLAALEERELNTRQGEQVRVRHGVGYRTRRNSDEQLKQQQRRG